ncbi:P123 protein [Dactylella cylindrospora]|nr:P123 protein [Dactylella cylindrospora]
MMSSRQPVDINEIPPIALFYKVGKLDTSMASESVKTPSQSINQKVILARMDMTRIKCDAIVNAANKSLLGGGGIDGAIHRAAGNGLFNECLDLNGCETGDAKITKGYRLPAKHVIHTVGPVYWTYKDEGEDPSHLLASCYIRSLDIARRNGAATVAFPCISTGVYGYPSGEAAHVACKTVREYLEKQDLEVEGEGEKEEEGKPETAEEKTETKEEEEGWEKIEKEEEPPAYTEVEKVDKENKEETGEPSKKEETTPEKKEEEPEKEENPEKEEKQEKEEEKPQPFICKIEKVCFCTFLEKDLAAYENAIPAYFPPVEEQGALDKLDGDEEKAPDGEAKAEEPVGEEVKK